MRIRAVVAVATIAVAAGVIAAPSGGQATPSPPCVGAAAHDPLKPCPNPTLAVEPSVKKVQKLGVSFCFPSRKDYGFELCTFGTPSKRSKSHIALLGDSHALAWRAAVEGMAKAQRWHGYSLTAPGCFYSDAVHKLPVGIRDPCTDWFEWARSWLRRNKQISTLFLAQRAETPVEVKAGQSVLSVRVAGAKRAWRALPKHIKHVVVIRDTPRAPETVFDCVDAAVKAGKHAGQACTVDRREALPRDTAVATVKSLRSKRYQAVDLSEFFCTGKLCEPVIGGVLVFRDPDHITPAYSKTLAPYLLRKVRALMEDW